MICQDCGREITHYDTLFLSTESGYPQCTECHALAAELVPESPYPPRTKVYTKPVFEYHAIEVTEERGPFARSIRISAELLWSMYGGKSNPDHLAIELALEKMAPMWKKAPGPSDPMYASYCAWLANEGVQKRKPVSTQWNVLYGNPSPSGELWKSMPQPFLKPGASELKVEYFKTFNSLVSLPVLMPDKYYLPPVVD